ncbi:MAG: ImmA/IrrE family metallo-endopeptidase [Planctomycetes bacterium]|nr:ImmA/IrrE family metallo-endopeptidase [Planctomycetota bacterium]
MMQRIATWRKDVPYPTKKQIEKEAALLLDEYDERHGRIVGPPIPIDEIVELHLGLTLEVKDMRRLFRFGDVHGALWMEQRVVGIDRSLDPAVHPNKRGRYHFTLAHEAGHWRLHRRYYVANPYRGELFTDNTPLPAHVCRSSEVKKPVEWQADFFAAAILMPRPMVRTAWESWCKTTSPMSLDQLRARTGERVIADMVASGMDEEAVAANLMEGFCRPLAGIFQVSAQAMRIRLEEIGLLTREEVRMLF